MTDKEKAQIRTLRESGCSYGEIARILSISRNTVKDFCARQKIVVMNSQMENETAYKLCPTCRQLFIASGRQKAARQFCSDKCRMEYWQREHRHNQNIADEAEKRRTLQKELDFLRKTSNELESDKELILCYRNESLIEKTKEVKNDS